MVEFTRQRLGDRRGLTLDRSTMRDQAGPILPDRCFWATSGLLKITGPNLFDLGFQRKRSWIKRFGRLFSA